MGCSDILVMKNGDFNLAFLSRMMTMKEEMTTTMMMDSLCPTVISQKGKEHLKTRYVECHASSISSPWHDTNSLLLQEGGDTEKQKVRQRMKAREWENELMSKGKVKVLEAVVRGCLWEGEQPSLDFLQPYSVCMLDPLPKDESCTPEQDLSRKQRNEKREYSVCLTVLFFMEILYAIRS